MILNQLRVNKDLLLEFFVFFSRCEFALKNSGFALGDLDGVRPDWNGLAVSLRDRFEKNASPRVLEACEYILEHPPNRQVLINGSLGWDTQGQRPGEPETDFLLRMVKSVRNNLFHGGKFNIELYEETARSEALLRHSLVILQECLRLSPQVGRAFHEAIM